MIDDSNNLLILLDFLCNFPFHFLEFLLNGFYGAASFVLVAERYKLFPSSSQRFTPFSQSLCNIQNGGTPNDDADAPRNRIIIHCTTKSLPKDPIKSFWSSPPLTCNVSPWYFSLGCIFFRTDLTIDSKENPFAAENPETSFKISDLFGSVLPSQRHVSREKKNFVVMIPDLRVLRARYIHITEFRMFNPGLQCQVKVYHAILY